MLQSYDEAESPVDSGWFFTRYFFPDAFDAGNRLEGFANDLFSLFLEIRQEFGIKGKIELPMEFIVFTIENALKIFGANGQMREWLSMDQWKEAIKRSGYIDSEIFMAIAKRKGT
ncbi:hypothetical protein [Paenibacillus periandrae]|uniref:hypothetical protein n=1 Tax=Paenibacillus periandrae TaxID=1761741 RepID=UPI001F094D0D|nr:hypothetical protein [Paenibacillus periandrae]